MQIAVTLLVVELCVPAAHRETGTHNTVLCRGCHYHISTNVYRSIRPGMLTVGAQINWARCHQALVVDISKLEPPMREIGRIKRFCKSSSWMITLTNHETIDFGKWRDYGVRTSGQETTMAATSKTSRPDPQVLFLITNRNDI